MMDKIINLYKKNKEIVNYLFFGILTTIVSLVIYYGLTFSFLDVNVVVELQIANILSWFISVSFAYITNKRYVFESKSKNVVKEFSEFIGTRIVTLVMDMLIMYVGVNIFCVNDKILKLVSQVIVIVGNYLFSKIFVFKK